MNDAPRDPDPGQTPEDPPEHKPATWAGRQRAGGDEPSAEADPPPPEEPPAEEPPAEDDGEADEEPPAEPDEEPEGAEAEGEQDGEEEEGEPATQQTVEADTLTAADREAAEEAAHAALRARAAQGAAKRESTAAHEVAAPVAAAAAQPPSTGEPPKRGLWWRFLAATLVIITSMATATAVSFLLFLSDIAEGLEDDNLDSLPQLEAVEGGAPQTILILGSDKRGGTPGDPGRSDTAMLLRVDPEKNFLALMSLPRDLKTEIPGYGTDKLNAAYSYGEQYEARNGGGPGLALETISELLGTEINHIVNIDFEGFYEAVNAIDCVYVDVDRHYYNPEGGDYDDIDIQAGYTKLCGYRALDYVRYRHTDNDIVRGARQQDFIREARQRIPPRKLLPYFGGDELIEIFTKYTSSDIDDIPTIVTMMKSFVEVRNAPVRQVDLESTLAGSYVVATGEQIETAVEQFLGEDLDDAPAQAAPAPEPKKDKPDKPKPPPEEPQLIDATAAGQQHAQAFQNYLREKKAALPVFYPTGIAPNVNTAITGESRAFPLAGPNDEVIYRGYKFVVSYQEEGFTSYYGLSGVNWLDPPILENPTEVRTIDGRDYLLFYDGDRLRLVGWKTARGSYWVINTLTRALSEAEMLAIATSARELGE